MSSSPLHHPSLQIVQDRFQRKLTEIHSQPNKLRRTTRHWPYYETLRKIIQPVVADDQQQQTQLLQLQEELKLSSPIFPGGHNADSDDCKQQKNF